MLTALPMISSGLVFVSPGLPVLTSVLDAVLVDCTGTDRCYYDSRAHDPITAQFLGFLRHTSKDMMSESDAFPFFSCSAAHRAALCRE